jgi:hypothetical protein
MFQDRTVQQVEKSKVMMPVILTLVDGETIKGAIAVPRNGRLGDVLNGSDRFILFETNGGEPLYLSHASIAAVQSNDMPKARQLEASLSRIQEVNPYKILKVEQGVSRTALKEAYHRLVKHYHPDQFANTPLPKEVRAYLDAVILRLNAAYEQIEDDIERIEKAKEAKLAAPKPAETPIRFFGQ